MGSAPTGAIVYVEFAASDAQRVQQFYGSLFGWTFQPSGDDYLMFTAPGALNGGFSLGQRPGAGVRAYIACDGVAAMLERIVAAGGRIVHPSEQLPADYGYIGTFADPEGNVVGLWSSSP